MIFIPLIITVFCLWQMFKPLEKGSDAIASVPLFMLCRLLWLIPIGYSWATYYTFFIMFAMSGKAFW